MKRVLTTIMFFIIVSFLGIIKANARITLDTQCEYSGNTNLECNYIVRADDNSLNPGSFNIGVNLTNLTEQSITNQNTNFHIARTTGGFDIDYPDTYLPKGDYVLFKIIYQKVLEAEECELNVSINPVGTRVCVNYNGFYYDGSGNKSTSDTQYQIDCVEHTCEHIGNYYFDGSGNKSTSDTQYQIDCVKHTCEKIANVYFDNDGNKVTSAEFESACGKKICEIVDSIYYGPDGEVVTEEAYNEACVYHPSCELYEDKYYNKDGEEITENEYYKLCLKYSCKITDGKYFNKDGDVVTKEEFELDCSDKTCKVIGEKYFDDKGLEITKDKYSQICLTATPTQTSKKNPETGDMIHAGVLIVFGIMGIGILAITRKRLFSNY